MSDISKNPLPLQPVPHPETDVLLFGAGKVSFAWNFTRKVPFWFLYYNPEPGSCLKFEDCTIHPDEKMLILIPPDTPFRSSSTKPFKHLYIHFTAGRPFSLVTPGVITMPPVCPELLQSLFDQPETPMRPAAIYALVYCALSAIPANRFIEDSPMVDDRIQRALSLINRGIDNQKLCAAIGMSASNFQRKFKQATGMSPQHYAMQLRLEKARCALSGSNDPIDKIAIDCGFADRYAFSKAFKKYTGVSPAKYRLGKDF